MDWANIDRLQPRDEVKFVIADRADYEYARDVARASRACRPRRGGALLAGARRARCARRSPSGCSPTRLPVRVQLQVHKYIWAPDTRGV